MRAEHHSRTVRIQLRDDDDLFVARSGCQFCCTSSGRLSLPGVIASPTAISSALLRPFQLCHELVMPCHVSHQLRPNSFRSQFVCVFCTIRHWWCGRFFFHRLAVVLCMSTSCNRLQQTEHL